MSIEEALSEAAEFLRNGTPIYPGSDLANELIRLSGQPWCPLCGEHHDPEHGNPGYSCE